MSFDECQHIRGKSTMNSKYWSSRSMKHVAGAVLLCGGLYFVTTCREKARTSETSSGVARVTADTTEFDFGRVELGTELQHHFTLSNRGKQRLVLILDRCGCGEDETGHMILIPGERVRIPVSMTVQNHSKRQKKSLTIITNDPANPRIELQISAQVAL